jgi:hypothetical protein
LKRDDLSIEMAPMIKQQIEALKKPAPKGTPPMAMGEDGEDGGEMGANQGAEDSKYAHLEQLIQEMNERLKAIEGKLQVKQ